jgi:hypothetical protein
LRWLVRFINWYTKDLPEELTDMLLAQFLNVVYLGVFALILWPAGKASMALSLGKGYYILWATTGVTAFVLYFIQRALRVDTDSHFDALVISNLAHCVLMLTGWSAFAALTVQRFVAGASAWSAAVVYLVGFLSSYVSCLALFAFYPGQIYKPISFIAALSSFVLFALWPAAGGWIYGWFFNLF